MAAIRTRMLCSGYGRTEVLHDVDFAAESGSLTAVVGSNGSGKSTLLRSVFGMCSVHSGTVTVDGLDITSVPAYRRIGLGISYMPQTDNVFGDLAVSENLAVASLPEKPDLDRITGFFPALGPLMREKAGRLSGGQRQLLATAMVMCRNPGIMMFDEPTAGLSPANSAAVLDRIRRMQRELGNCAILVEQNVRAALALCDRCYLFSGGRVVYEGPPGTLLNDEDLGRRYLGAK